MDIRGDETNGVAITSVKKRLDFVFTTQGHEIRLYSLDPIKHITAYPGHVKPINAMEFLDATTVMSVSNQIVMHDVSRTDPVRRIQPGLDTGECEGNYHKLKITDVVVLNPDLLAICDENRFVKVYDLRQATMFRPVQRFRDASDSLNTVEYDKSWFQLFCGGSEGALFTYDLRQGLLTRDPVSHCITDLQVVTRTRTGSNPAKGTAITMNTFGGVQTMECASGRVVEQLHKHPDDKEYLVDVAIGPDGVVLSGSEHGCVYVWEDGRERMHYNMGHSHSHSHSHSHAQGQGVVVAALDVRDGVVVAGDNNGCLYHVNVSSLT